MTSAFDDGGFSVVTALLSDTELARIDTALAGRSQVGARDLLAESPGASNWRFACRPMRAWATGISRRRVLHFLFGPRALPCGLAWPPAR